MLYKWLETKDHSVKNFNKIFNLSQLEGFLDGDEVVIGEIQIGGLREVFVRDNMFLIELKCSNMTILLDKNNILEFKISFNRNEKAIIGFLRQKGNMTYGDLKKELSMTANVFSKTVYSLKNKQVIEEIGKSLGKNSKNKMLKLKIEIF